MFSPDGDDTFMVLLTLSGSNLPAPIRLSDNYTQRLSETDEDVLYGTISRGQQFVFLPLQIVLPSEEMSGTPRASVSINDVTRIVMPQLRAITAAPDVLLELVLKSAPDSVEISFSGLKLSSISYNAQSVTGDLTMDSLALEPFPCHSFSPVYFPGLF